MAYLNQILTSQIFSSIGTLFSRPKQCLAAALLVGMSAPIIAASPGSSHFAKGLARGFIGEEVESISGVETLTNWNTLDTRRLTLRVNHAERYLLTLDDHCDHLRGAQLVGVSMTNQEIWADFDHVAADGHECRIDRITRLRPRSKSS